MFVLIFVDNDSVCLFMGALGILKLSDCLTVDYTTELYRPCPPLQKYVYDLLPYIQKLLYSDYTEVYDAFKAISVEKHLASMSFGSVSIIRLVLRTALKSLLEFG